VSLARLCLLFLVALTMACKATLHAGRSRTVTGPGSAEIPAFRDRRTQDKLFVEVGLSDGQPHLFLVDTGSSVTVISRKVANDLGLTTKLRPGRLVGLSGSVPWQASVLGTIRLGPYTLRDIDVAVDVPGVPSHVGLVPLAGILGNNVLAEFQVAIDYPAQTIALARGDMEIPESAEPMFFNGQHPLVRGTLLASRGETVVRQPVLLEVDTGARGLMITGRSQSGLAAVATEGEEPIVGIGAHHRMPTSGLLRRTRRVAVHETRIGGATITQPILATWLDFSGGDSSVHHAGMPGLLGYEVFKNHRLVLDFIGRRIAIADPGPAVEVADIHKWYLKRLQRNRDPASRVESVRVHFWLGQEPEARSLLARLVAKSNPLPGAVVLQARLDRRDGDHDGARERLRGLTVRDLSVHGELVAWVNSLWLAGDVAGAVEHAQTATVLEPDAVSSWVAYADALRAAGRMPEARKAIAEANRVDENPDGHLLRRGWLAVEEGDNHGALTHLRRLIELEPNGGVAQWIYAMLGANPRQTELIRQDLMRAQKRLHDGEGPLDFMAAAWRQLGDQSRAEDLMAQGRARDCEQAPSTVNRDNCEAWYLALIGRDLPDARARIDRAVAADPDKAEFLDTLAIVLEAQGEFTAARDAAFRAAAHSPSDVYLILQAARLDAKARSDKAAVD
jgi:tetratricopeptide (TPR) repeat protein